MANICSQMIQLISRDSSWPIALSPGLMTVGISSSSYLLLPEEERTKTFSCRSMLLHMKKIWGLCNKIK
ncbi:unnamed protein product, partial [Didymodactylos carnosus]